MSHSPQNCSVSLSSGVLHSFSQDLTETVLCQNQAFSQQILDSSDDCIKVLDLAGRLQFISRSGQALLGIQDFTPLLNAVWVDFWQGADRQAAIAAVAAATSGQVYNFQGYCPTQSGEPKWWDVKVSPIRNAAGQIERLLCISRDITERRQLELDRQQAQTQLAAIFSHAAVGLAELSLTGQFQRVNDEFCRILGRSRAQLLTATVAEVTHAEDVDRNLEAFERLIETGAPVSFDKRYFHSDGSIVWANISLTRLDDEQGRPRAVLSVTVELNQRIQTETALRRALEELQTTEDELRQQNEALVAARELAEQEGHRYQDLFDLAPDGYVVTDAQGMIREANQAIAALLDRSQSYLINRPLAVYFPESDRRAFRNLLSQLYHSSEAQRLQTDTLSLQPYRGHPVPVAITATAIRDAQAQIIGVRWFIQDITERKQAEDLAQRAAEFDAFRVSLADALRPLTDPIEIQVTASRVLGQYLGVNRVVYFEVRDDQYVVQCDYVHGVQPLAGRYPIALFGAKMLAAYCSGHPITASDVAGDPNLSPDQRSTFAAVGIGAYIGIPLIKQGEFVAGLAVHSVTARSWKPDEIALAEEVAERTWAAVERARAEADLRESEQKYRMLFDSIDQGFAVCELIFDAQGQPYDYRFLVVNPAFGKLTGLREVVGKTARELVPNIEREPWIEVYGKVVQTGEPVRFEQQSIALDRWFDANAFPVDEPHRFAVLFSEISDRKRIEAERQQAEVALRESEAQTRNILESISDGFFALDRDWRFTYVNSAAQQLINRSANELLGNKFWDEFPAVIGSEFESIYPRAMIDRVPGSVTAFYPDHDRWYEVSCYPAANGITLYFKDVSHFKRAEAEREQLLRREQTARHELEHANRIKDEFLAMLSHELRTPLNPILGWTRLMESGRLDSAKSKEALSTIRRNAQLQAQLIEDLLDLSRILRGKLSLTVVPVKFATPIGAAIATLRFAAEAKHLTIQTILDPTVPPVAGDPNRLQQVVWNLLSNAVKFTDAGGRIEVRLTQVGSMAQLIVSDTGKGIAAEFLPHVFEHFRQEDGSTTRKFGGLGLGLAIVRQIVELHGGTVQAESLGENQGATFTVQLPVMQQAVSEMREPGRPPATGTLLNQVQILLVDDDRDTREFQTFVLEQSGATVTTVASGIEVLQALDRFTPDLLVSDVGMPGMDGYQLIQQIRSRSVERGGDLVAIALTAYAAELDQRRALKAGFQAHLTKPVDPEMLVDTIAQLLGLSG